MKMVKQSMPKPAAPAQASGTMAGAGPQASAGEPSVPAGAPGTPGEENAPAGTAAAAGAAGREKTKVRLAEHDWVNAQGDVVEDMEEATGIKYRSLGDEKAFVYQIPGAKAGDVLTMFAVFGARTKATNSALAAREKRKRDNEFKATDLEHVEALFGEIKEGQWGAPSESKPKGPKYDLDVLAAVIADSITAAGGAPDLAKIREKCGDSPAYVRGAIAFTDENGVRTIEREYNKRKGVSVAPKSALSLAV